MGEEKRSGSRSRQSVRKLLVEALEDSNVRCSLAAPGTATVAARVRQVRGDEVHIDVQCEGRGIALRRRAELLVRTATSTLPFNLPVEVLERWDSEGTTSYRIAPFDIDEEEADLPGNRVRRGIVPENNREAFRVRPHISRPVAVEIADPYGTVRVPARLVDLSNDGLGLLVTAEDEARLSRVTSAAVRLGLDDGESIDLETQIRRRRLAPFGAWLGCVITRPSPELTAFVIRRQQSIMRQRGA